MRVRGQTAMVALVGLALWAAAAAAEELPPFWVAVSAGGAELDAGPEAQPPGPTTEPIATVAPGEALSLHAKIVGGRRAFMMWPETYANVGPDTTVLAHGYDAMEYRVQTEGFVGTGKWTATEETYAWDTGGQGVLSPLDQTGERVAWTAPAQPGAYQISVSGSLKLHFRREALGNAIDRDEESGEVSRTVTIAVGDAQGQPPVAGTTTTQTVAPEKTHGGTDTVPPETPVQPVTPPAGGASAPGVTITTPREGDRVKGRVTVAGTGKPGALIVVSTEVRAQDDDELLRDVPGSRHAINADGTWQVWVAAPVLPANIAEPLYFVIKAKWVTPGEESGEARVKVFRAE